MGKFIYYSFVFGIVSLCIACIAINQYLKEHISNKAQRIVSILILLYGLFILFGIAYESTIQNYVNTNW